MIVLSKNPAASRLDLLRTPHHVYFADGRVRAWSDPSHRLRTGL